MQRPLPSSSSSTSPSATSPSSSSLHSKPKTPTTSRNSNISRTAILSAKAEEASRREAAIYATAAGAEERWSLSIPNSERATELRGGGVMLGNVRVLVGASGGSGELGDDVEDDDEEEEEENTATNGSTRRYFGGRAAPVVEAKKRDAPDGDASDSSDYNSDTDASEGELAQRAELKRARKAEKKHKEADRALRGLKQIGGRANASGNDAGDANMECFGCGEKGHRKADCPRMRKGNGSGVAARGKRGYGRGEPAVKRQKRY
ncbi:hypothetical protein ABW20_dc0105072 [Dactylellina cionopaga]|nr:hypothetical protein ABW20_dc0105072 [Dactylellina cionopaga]